MCLVESRAGEVTKGVVLGFFYIYFLLLRGVAFAVLWLVDSSAGSTSRNAYSLCPRGIEKACEGTAYLHL